VTAASAGNPAARRRILQLLLMAALIAAPISWADAHLACGFPEASADVSPSAIDDPGAIPMADGDHLHFDQCCQHAQVEASFTPAVCAASCAHPPERLRKVPLPGTTQAPYRPPIA